MPMNLNNIITTTKVVAVTVFLLSLLNDVLPNTLTREELTACVYWDELEYDRCYPGRYLGRINGTSDCIPCPEGTFMAWQNKCPQCLPFRDCGGREVLFPGNFMYDRVCVDFPVSTESAVPSKLTEDAGNPPSSSEDEEEGDELIDENKSTPPSDPNESPDDKADPSDDLDMGTNVIKFDCNPVELLLIFVSGAFTASLVFVSVLVYLKKCSKQKCCKCQCDSCKHCTVGDRRDSDAILPLRKKHASGDTNGNPVDGSETSSMLSKGAHQKKKNPARGRKRPSHSSS